MERDKSFSDLLRAIFNNDRERLASAYGLVESETSNKSFPIYKPDDADETPVELPIDDEKTGNPIVVPSWLADRLYDACYGSLPEEIIDG